jgi:hypothetical protein
MCLALKKRPEIEPRTTTVPEAAATVPEKGECRRCRRVKANGVVEQGAPQYDGEKLVQTDRLENGDVIRTRVDVQDEPTRTIGTLVRVESACTRHALRPRARKPKQTAAD